MYKLLKTDRDTVYTRGLRIARSLTAEGHIKCTLVQLRVWATPGPNYRQPYVALSYVWGSENGMRFIEVDGLVVTVRHNLFDFLDYARKQFAESTLYWIDALCINQADLEERSQQVKHMGRIYNAAKYVLVWLGASDSGNLNTFIRISRNFHSLTQAGAEEGVTFPRVSRKFFIPRSPKKLPISSETLEALCHSTANWSLQDWFAMQSELAENQYWHRAWTEQEFLLAQEVKFCFPENIIAFEDIHKAFHPVYGSFRDKLSGPSPEIDQLLQHLNRRVQIPLKQRKLSDNILEPTLHSDVLSEIISRREIRNSSDIRDRIYSRLSRTKNASYFNVNYAESPFVLLLRTLIFYADIEGVQQGAMQVLEKVNNLAFQLELDVGVIWSDVVDSNPLHKVPEDVGMTLNKRCMFVSIQNQETLSQDASSTQSEQKWNDSQPIDVRRIERLSNESSCRISWSPDEVDAEGNQSRKHIYFHSDSFHTSCVQKNPVVTDDDQTIRLDLLTILWLAQLCKREAMKKKVGQ